MEAILTVLMVLIIIGVPLVKEYIEWIKYNNDQ